MTFSTVDLTPENTCLQLKQDPSQSEPSATIAPAEEVSVPSIDLQNTAQLPFWLSKYALLIFAAVFTALAVSLIAIKGVSDAQDGFPLALSSSEYSWTYGPTAVLVVVLSFWRRVDYYYKAAEPWRELQSGLTPGSRSLLLDYVSPFQLQSMYQACKFRHYRIISTIASLFLLKAVILVSTTLFLVHASSHSVTLRITYKDTFDAAKAWSSPPFVAGKYPSLDGSRLYGGSDSFIWNYLARTNNAVANDSGWNVRDGRVTQRFAPAVSTLNMTSLRASVDTFLPIVDCEEANLFVDLPADVDDMQYYWSSTTCSTRRNTAYQCADDFALKNSSTLCSDPQLVYTVHRVNCSADAEWDGGVEFRWPDDVENYDIRYAISSAQYTIDMDYARENTSKAIEFVYGAAVICKFGYSIMPATAAYEILAHDVSLTFAEIDGERRSLHNLTNSSLAEMILSGLDNAFGSLVINTEVTPFTSSVIFNGWHTADSLFQLMAQDLPTQFEPGVFLKPSILLNTTVRVFSGLLNEFARASLLVSKASDGTAEGRVSEMRLRTRNEVVWIMVSGFAVLATICLLLLFTPVKGVWVPAMCGSIAGHAVVLANSRSLQESLRGLGHYSDKELTKELKATLSTASLDSDRVLSINIIDSSQPSINVSRHERSTEQKPWAPVSGRLYFVMATLICPALAIVALELLHRLSHERDGLVDIPETGSNAMLYVVRLSSTAAAFTIATLTNSFDFTIATFAPFSSLRLGNAQAERSILLHLLSVSPFLTAIKSIQRRQFGPAASNISSLLSSFLTIIVSGLWIRTGPIIIERPSSAMVRNWCTSWSAQALDDGGAGIQLNLIRHGGTSTPVGIWQDLVLPDIHLVPSGPVAQNTSTRTSEYVYTVGALRPWLECSVIPKANHIRTVQKSERHIVPEYYIQTISASYVPGASCRGLFGGMGGTSFGFQDTASKGLLNSTRVVGRYFDLGANKLNSSSSCPSIGILFGTLGSIDTSQWNNMTALVCSQGIEQIPVRVTYRGSHALGQISQRYPPEVRRDKAWRWLNETSKSEALGYSLEVYFRDYLAWFQGPTGWSIDSFFDQLLYRSDGAKFEDLHGPENTDALVKAIERDYSEYMRHAINLNFRASTNTTHGQLVSSEGDPSATNPFSAHTTIVGTEFGQVARLAIDPTSKLILQILLAFIAALNLVGYLLVKISGTLPRNPCSIASTMAYLAGSQLCDRDSVIIPQGAEYMTDGEQRKAFDGWVFSLGWWQKGEASVESEERSDDARTSGETDPPNETREGQRTLGRFGIDVGRANASKF
ncbi:hypothetical protein FGLOB1_9171 [Fusarium globosum]|uniref:Uncharacterized protein n=1 Tax=Fusarium globosum TaxID=78864 RepID=A0A8H5XZN7_9HYPO|nr:hypothetical protein FGLOB1_9171 [Fusarium globosum]